MYLAPDCYNKCMTLTLVKDGVLQCAQCGKSIRGRIERVSACPVCRAAAKELKTEKFPIINQPPVCLWGAIVQRLNPGGLSGLDRCRAANCGHLQIHGGRIVCVGRGKSCEWLGLWAAWLNSGRGCPHWLPLASPEPHHDLGNAHEDQR